LSLYAEAVIPEVRPLIRPPGNKVDR
jgi:hypothetical protein